MQDFLAAMLPSYGQPRSNAPIRFIFGNGIGNKSSEGVAPLYANVFARNLMDSGVPRNAMYLLPLYESGGILSGASDWKDDLKTNVLTDEVAKKLRSAFSDHMQGDTLATAVLYSGNFNPCMKALAQVPTAKVGTVVAVGAAWEVSKGTYVNASAGNQHLKLLVNVYGAQDPLYTLLKVAGPIRLTNAQTINVKLIGVNHTDYFFNESKPSEINVKARAFVVDLTLRSEEGAERVRSFMDKIGAKYDAVNQEYTYDVRKYSRSKA
jgi:hypothetical protein